MPYSAYFAERAEHYRKLAMMAPNGWQAESQFGLANLFLEMSCDMRLRERNRDGTHLWKEHADQPDNQNKCDQAHVEVPLQNMGPVLLQRKMGPNFR